MSAFQISNLKSNKNLSKQFQPELPLKANLYPDENLMTDTLENLWTIFNESKTPNTDNYTTRIYGPQENNDLGINAVNMADDDDETYDNDILSLNSENENARIYPDDNSEIGAAQIYPDDDSEIGAAQIYPDPDEDENNLRVRFVNRMPFYMNTNTFVDNTPSPQRTQRIRTPYLYRPPSPPRPRTRRIQSPVLTEADRRRTLELNRRNFRDHIERRARSRERAILPPLGQGRNPRYMGTVGSRQRVILPPIEHSPNRNYRTPVRQNAGNRRKPSRSRSSLNARTAATAVPNYQTPEDVNYLSNVNRRLQYTTPRTARV